MIVTSREVQQILGIGPSGVRMLVLRRRLAPIKRGAHPLEFHASDVERIRVARLTPTERAGIEALHDEADTLHDQASGVALQVSGV